MLNTGRVLLAFFLITIGILRLERDGFVWQAGVSFFFAVFNLIPVGSDMVDKVFEQITLRRERAQRRRNYELFRDGVKSGLITTDEQFNDEARKVIK